MPTGVLLALVILAMPLLSSLVIGTFKKQLGTKSDAVGIGLMGIALAISAYLAIAQSTFAGQNYVFEWFTVGGTSWKIGVALDGLTIAMLVVVSLVSFLVHLFSKGYMHGDARYEDFYRWLGFFTFSMIGLVISDNLITL